MDLIVTFPLLIGFKSSSYLRSSTNKAVMIIASRQEAFKVPHKAYVDVNDGLDAASGSFV